MRRSGRRAPALQGPRGGTDAHLDRPHRRDRAALAAQKVRCTRTDLMVRSRKSSPLLLSHLALLPLACCFFKEQHMSTIYSTSPSALYLPLLHRHSDQRSSECDIRSRMIAGMTGELETRQIMVQSQLSIATASTGS